MDGPLGNFQHRIGCLETHLTIERQRVAHLEQTIIYLSALLARQVNITAPVKQIAAVIEPVNDQRVSEISENVKSSVAVGEVVQNLIDIDINTPLRNISALRGQAPVFTPQSSAGQDSEKEGNQSSSGHVLSSAPSSFNSIPTEPFSRTNNVVSLNDEPPTLDLQFKGLRTAHDGPIKDIAPKPIEAERSARAPLFEEVFFRTTKPGTAEDKHQLQSPIQTKPDPLPTVKPGTKIEGTPDALLQSLSNSIASFSNSTSYRSTPIPPAQRSYGSNSIQDSDCFHKPLSLLHGVRYKPKEDDLFLNRSRVLIFNLPIDIKLTDIISKLRGGTIISCELLHTEFAYDSLTAMVRFSSYVEAMRCVDYTTSNPISLNGMKASIQIIPTPSYPLPPAIYKNIFERGHTRCLKIYEYQRRVPAHIRQRYNDPKFIEHQARNGCGDWFVRFTSVQRASALWSELEALRILKPGECGFMADPCDVEDSIEFKVWKDKDIKVMDVGTLKWEN